MDKENKPKDSSSEIDEIKIDNDIFTESFITRQDKILKSGSGQPSYNPRNFKEQFYFEDNGTLWVNINNVWRSFGSSNVVCGNSTHTGEQSDIVFNVGFTPKVLKITGIVNASTAMALSIGYATSVSEQKCKVIYEYKLESGNYRPITENYNNILNCLDDFGSSASYGEIIAWGNNSITLRLYATSFNLNYQYEILG